MERRAWLVVAALALAGAAVDVARWVATIASGLPAGYGEGAVVHAGQLLARSADPYALEPPGTFVSANYPPLAYVVVALGQGLGPFTALRLVNVVLAGAIAGLVAWRARADRVVAVALGASFLALYPVGAWVAGDRVDVLAVAGTAFAVVALAAGNGVAFGVLGALALAAKPTAALPLGAVALAALALRAHGARRGVVALAVAGAVLAAVALARFDPRGLYEHLVTHNALPYDAGRTVLLAAFGALFLGGFVVAASRVAEPLFLAYLGGALAVVVLVGHEGATYNYLLDLAAASCLALAPLAPMRAAAAPGPPGAALPAARPWWIAPVLVAELAVTLAFVTVGPLAPAAPDAQRARVDLAAVAIARAGGAPVLAEDSALLVANGIEPVVDDLFVWSRLVALGVRADDLTPRVASRAFGAVITDVRLDELDRATEIERLRWPAPLVDRLRREYELRRSAPGAYLYLPRGAP